MSRTLVLRSRSIRAVKEVNVALLSNKEALKTEDIVVNLQKRSLHTDNRSFTNFLICNVSLSGGGGGDIKHG